ncbi:t-SNARE [Auriculariales sp. MPI-PUGE-AT-0066]|nr:t-SNARE [Auriculariales sp. MPI-PUGE-AT-0066]
MDGAGSSSSRPPVQPTTRSRTLLFLSYRDSKARGPRRRRDLNGSRRASAGRHCYDTDERAGLIGKNKLASTSHISLDMSPISPAFSSHVDLPPKYVDTSDEIGRLLDGIQLKIASLDKLHARHVLPGFADRTQEERDIEALTTDITRDFRRCQKLVQAIVPPAGQSYPPSRNHPESDDAAARNVQRALAAKIQDASAVFRKKQRVYMDKLTGHATKNADLLVASGTVSLKGSDSRAAVEDDIRVVRQAGHCQRQMQQQYQSDPALSARTTELTHLAESIGGLAELFRDLGQLVIDQGTILDSVEYNIERAAVDLEEAEGELKVAQRYQRNTGRRKCMFLLVLLIVGAILIIIFKPRHK